MRRIGVRIVVALTVLLAGCSGCASNSGAGGAGDASGTVDGSNADMEVGVADVDVGTDVDDVGTDADADVGGDVRELRDPEPFDEYVGVVEEMRDGLRTSPDHLPARAEQLVQAGDAPAIFEFVRDEIAVVPEPGGDISEPNSYVRWGPRATLRAGQGTVREKAELLAELLRRAGHDAEVVGGLNPPSSYFQLDRLRDMVWRPVERRFAPNPPDDATLTRWSEVVRAEGAAPAGEETLDAKALARADAIVQTVSPLLSVPGSPDPWIRQSLGLPAVRVDDGTGPRIVNPHLPGESWENEYQLDSVGDAPPTTDLLPVEIDVEYATAAVPDVWLQAVSGQWTADQVAGRQVRVAFTPADSMLDLHRMPVGSAGVVTPVLAVQGADLDDQESADLSAMGEPFTVGGSPVAVDEAQSQATIDGRRLSVDGAETDPALLDRVDRLEATVAADGFPSIEVSVRAFDATGSPVDGLGADALTISEEERPQTATLVQNQTTPARILFLLDASTSVPTEFRSAQTASFLSDVAQSVLDDYANAEFAVSPLLPTDDQIATTWTSTPSDVEAQANAVFMDGSLSHMWHSLAQAQTTGATAVVMVVDGDATDEPTRERVAAIGAGPPAIVVHVGEADPALFVEPAVRLTEGTSVTATDTEQVRQPLEEFLARRANTQYVARYVAAVDGPQSRTVEVALRDRSPEASGTYDVPQSPQPPSQITGLRMRLKVGQREVTRLLAGTDDAEVAAAAPEPVVDDVSTALFGSRILSFEAGSPPLSVWLDDHFSAVLDAAPTMRPMWRGELVGGLAALDEAPDYLPPMLFAAAPPLQDASTETVRTFPDGLRTVMFTERTDPATSLAAFEFDILPTAGFQSSVRTVDGLPEPDPAFTQTLRRTALLAAAESLQFDGEAAAATGAGFGTSTYKMLDGEDLTALSPGPDGYRDLETLFAGLDPAELAAWEKHLAPYQYGWHALVPTDGEPRAFWVVHRETGELYGIVPDGRGGADRAEQIRDLLQEFDRVMAVMSLVGTGLGVSPAVGIVQIYGQFLVRLYAIAGVMIATMDVTMVERQIAMALAQMACNLVVEAIFVGPLQAFKWVKSINEVFAVGGSGISCPGPF